MPCPWFKSLPCSAGSCNFFSPGIALYMLCYFLRFSFVVVLVGLQRCLSLNKFLLFLLPDVFGCFSKFGWFSKFTSISFIFLSIILLSCGILSLCWVHKNIFSLQVQREKKYNKTVFLSSCGSASITVWMHLLDVVTRWLAFVSMVVGVGSSQRIPLSVLTRNPHKGLAREISHETGRGREKEGPRVKRRSQSTKGCSQENWREQRSRQKRTGQSAGESRWL